MPALQSPDRTIKGHLIVLPLLAAAGSESTGDRFQYEGGGQTYLVPLMIEGERVRPLMKRTQLVTANPTGLFRDMSFSPVQPHSMEEGLTLALTAALRRDYAATEAGSRLVFD